MNKKLPMFATAGAVIWGKGLYDAYSVGIPGVVGAGTNAVSYKMFGWYPGMTSKWYPETMLKNNAPIILGCVMSLLASKSGLNRYLSKVPFIKG